MKEAGLGSSGAGRVALTGADGAPDWVPEIPPEGLDLEATLDRLEQQLLHAALERCGGVQTRAAELLKMSFRQFRYKLHKREGRDPSREDQ